MRIGVNCFLLGPHIGGLKQYFHSLLNYLLNYDWENDYILFYFDHNINELELLRSDRWRAKAIHLNDQLEVSNHLEEFDIYFCPFGCLWPMPIAKPSVVTLVDIQEKYFPEFFTVVDLRAREYYFDGSTHMADRVITISQFSKNSIVHFHHISPKKIDVIYLCADERIIRAEQTKPDIGLALPERFIFYPANHWKHKNHECLLQALRLLRDRHGLRIATVFTGYDQPNGYPLNDKIYEYGLADQVYNAGYLSVEQMAYLYRRAFLLCFPSHFEGFGIPLVEAMSLGCPIVCAKTSSIPEVVGDAALLFAPNDPLGCASQIRRLWINEAERQQLICRARMRARQFSSEKLAMGHLAVFGRAQKDFAWRRYFWRKFIFHPIHKARCCVTTPTI
jgi:glycosyltransferase involved in cell wall biosynthesis